MKVDRLFGWLNGLNVPISQRWPGTKQIGQKSASSNSASKQVYTSATNLARKTLASRPKSAAGVVGEFNSVDNRKKTFGHGRNFSSRFWLATFYLKVAPPESVCSIQ